MTGPLDAFLQPQVVKPKQDPGIFVQENCTDCGTLFDGTEPWYHLRIKGKEQPYCQDCAKKHLPKPKPKEKEEDDEGTNTSADQ